MSTVTINGNSFAGRNVVIINGKVIVDGHDVTPDGKVINISVDGDVDSLKVDACERVTVSGSCNSVSTMSGDVHAGDVKGDVKTSSGDIECGAIQGDVSTMSGDIKCGAIGGSAKSMSGDIKHR